MAPRASTFVTSFRSGLSRRQFVSLPTEYPEMGNHRSLSTSLFGRFRLSRGYEKVQCVAIAILFCFAIAFFFLPIVQLPLAGIPFILRHDVSTFEPPKIHADWSEGSLEANGIRIRYYQTVQSTANGTAQKPKLVFLHGLTASAGALIPLLSDLSNDFQIFCPDARGHGGSNHMPPKSFTMDNLVTDALAAIRLFADGDKVFLGGHSMGASTAARVAQKAPDLFRAAVLEDPPWLRLPGEPIENPHRALPPMFADARKLHKLSQEQLAALDRRANALPPLAASPLASLNAFNAEAIGPTFIRTDDAINEAVPGIVVPTLLQTGGRLAVCRPRVAKKILQSWAEGSEYNFKDAPHILHAPPHRDEWVENVRAFYKGHLA